MKRDGNNMMSSIQTDLLYSDNSTTAANTVLAQMEAVPKLLAQLRESPEEVVKDFEEIRKLGKSPGLLLDHAYLS